MKTKFIENLIVKNVLGENQAFNLGEIAVESDKIDGRKISEDGSKVDASTDGTNCGKTARCSYLYDTKALNIGFNDYMLSENNLFNIENHGLVNGDILRMTTTTSLPGTFSTGTDYYVIDADDNTFRLSLSRGGAAETFSDVTGSASGSGSETYDHTLVVNQYGDIALGDPLPDNAIVMNAYVDVVTALDNGGDVFTLEIETSGDLVSSNTPYSAGIKQLAPNSDVNQAIKLTTERYVILDTGSARITDGDLVVFLDYVISE